MAELIVAKEGIEYALAVATAVSEMMQVEGDEVTYSIGRIEIWIDGYDQGLSLVPNDNLDALDVSFKVATTSR